MIVASELAAAAELQLADLANTVWSGVYTNEHDITMGTVVLTLGGIDANGAISGSITTDNLAGRSMRTEPIQNPTLEQRSSDEYVFAFSSQVADGNTANARMIIKTSGRHAGERMEGDVDFGGWSDVRYRLEKE